MIRMRHGWFFCSSPPILAKDKPQSSPPSAHLVVRETGEIVCALPGLEILELPSVPKGYVLACSRCLELSEALL